MKASIMTKTILAATLACVKAATTGGAQTDSRFYRPLTLAPADAACGGGGGTDEAAELTPSSCASASTGLARSFTTRVGDLMML